MIVRTALPADAEQIVALIKMQYGQYYANQNFYDRDYIASHIKNETMNFVVAEEDGFVIGCMGAEVNDGFVHYVSLTVLPGYRGNGVAKALFLEIHKRHDKPPFVSTYAEVITLFPNIASLELSCGMKPSGFIPNRFYTDGSRDKKLTHIVFGQRLRAFSPQKFPQSKTMVFKEHDYAEIMGYSEDLPDVAAITVFLDLQESCENRKKLENKGFIYTGTQPCTKTPYMIMHRSPGMLEAIRNMKLPSACENLRATILEGVVG